MTQRERVRRGIAKLTYDQILRINPRTIETRPVLEQVFGSVEAAMPALGLTPEQLAECGFVHEPNIAEAWLLSLQEWGEMVVRKALTSPHEIGRFLVSAMVYPYTNKEDELDALREAIALAAKSLLEME